MIYQQLYDRFKKKDTITAGIIGSGHFGTAVLTQSQYNPLLSIPIVADQNVENARKAFGRAGISGDRLVVCDTASGAQQAIEREKYVIVQDPMILMQLPLDVIGEATGMPEAGACHALAAIQHGKHVVMINKETDSAVGPILQHFASKAGLVYTPVDGDQHGLLIGLVSWAKTLGLEIISAGKARDAEFVFDRKLKRVTCEADGITVHETRSVQLKDDELDLFDELPDGRSFEYMNRRKSLLQTLPMAGGFDLCELTIMVNATDLVPDIPATHEPIIRIGEIPQVLCSKYDGGILHNKSSVEVVTVFRDKFEAGLGGGVFIVVSAPNEYSQMILTSKGCISNRNASAALIYRPYHLCGVETSTSFLCAGMLGLTTGSETYRPRYDLVRIANRDMKAGDKPGNDHDTAFRSVIVAANPLEDEAPVPANMLNGNPLLYDVPAGTVINCGMVKKPKNSVLWQLRQQQDKLFLAKQQP